MAMEKGTVCKVIGSDYEVRKNNGDLVSIKFYDPVCDEYYVQAYGGQTCCYVKAKDLEVADV